MKDLKETMFDDNNVPDLKELEFEQPSTELEGRKILRGAAAVLATQELDAELRTSLGFTLVDLALDCFNEAERLEETRPVGQLNDGATAALKEISKRSDTPVDELIRRAVNFWLEKREWDGAGVVPQGARRARSRKMA
jgi:hypothetical protein